MFDLDKIDWGALIIEYGTGLLKALVILIIGLWLTRVISGSDRRAMERKELDPNLRGFLGSLIKTLLQVIVLITALSMLGVEMTSLVALLAAAGLAIGLALSGTLQNFAGGVMILIFKPYEVGDLITAQGHTGIVREITIFTTNLTSLQHREIIIPNGPFHRRYHES